MLIHEYADDGDVDGIRRELAGGAEVDSRDSESGFTPLMIACASRRASVDVVRLLIEKGADVNASHAEAMPPVPDIDLDALQKTVSELGGQVAEKFDIGLMSRVKGLLSSAATQKLEMRDHVLKLAIQSDDLEKVRLLLDAGADSRYQSSGGYNALIDVMHGRPIARNPQLVPMVQLLIARGAELNTVTSYSESALTVASNNGRFDAVRVLLNAGADPSPLQWTALMRSVALGDLEDVQSELGKNPDLAAFDFWERTAWLLSLQTGDLAKAKLILAAGANRLDRGRCRKTPLEYAILSGRVELVRWLLAEGFDPNEPDQFGRTPLKAAVDADNVECVQALLDAGVEIHSSGDRKAIVADAASVPVLRQLFQRGADISEISDEMRGTLTRVPLDGKLRVSFEEYTRTKHPQFGKSNPEKMDFPFWKAMVTSGCPAHAARSKFDDMGRECGPVWCFQRFGKSLTELPDGRIIEIAGEHEDYYDPDFCIYNDVIVHHADGTFDIYGYPRAVFPPTDFHTATLIGNEIVIIGNLGYGSERNLDKTPVYRLNCDTLEIQFAETSGESPNWICKHRAELVGPRCIKISGGNIAAKVAEGETFFDNSAVFVLNVDSLEWTKEARPTDS